MKEILTALFATFIVMRIAGILGDKRGVSVGPEKPVEIPAQITIAILAYGIITIIWIVAILKIYK